MITTIHLINKLKAVKRSIRQRDLEILNARTKLETDPQMKKGLSRDLKNMKMTRIPKSDKNDKELELIKKEEIQKFKSKYGNTNEINLSTFGKSKGISSSFLQNQREALDNSLHLFITLYKYNPNSNEYEFYNGFPLFHGMRGGSLKNKIVKKKKKKYIRKHKGIYQTGNKSGQLKPGYKYSNEKLKSKLFKIKKIN